MPSKIKTTKKRRVRPKSHDGIKKTSKTRMPHKVHVSGKKALLFPVSLKDEIRMVYIRDFRDIQKHVGGMFTHYSPGYTKPQLREFHILVNEEGHCRGLKHNEHAGRHLDYHFVGPALFTKLDVEGDRVGLTDEEIEFLKTSDIDDMFDPDDC